MSESAPVIDNGTSVIDNTSRNERVRQAMKRHRRRRTHGLHRWSFDVTDAQLDALEVRGYLDPDRRGDRLDECDAIEMFLTDSLNKP